MQRIVHEPSYTNAHWLLDDLEQLYVQFSDFDVPKPTSLLSRKYYDTSFKTLCDLFYQYSTLTEFPKEFKEYNVTPLELPEYNPKNIIVCSSGGKDSFATIRYYQKEGYNVYVYHIKGLNKTYYDEWKISQAAAQKLGLPFILDSVHYSGNHIWVEHPMKNMIMANMALSYGIRHNITTKIATGNFNSSFLADCAFGVCGGDCNDMWEAYEQIVNRFIKGFQVYRPNLNYQVAYELLAKDADLLQYTISCVTPVRFRKLFRDRTEKNYNIKLLPNRCGCCWKDAVEYIWFADHNVLELNKEYYFHCIEVLAYTTSKELGFIRNVKRLWSLYFFYPMEESKLYKELDNAFISAKGKIKFTN